MKYDIKIHKPFFSHVCVIQVISDYILVRFVIRFIINGMGRCISDAYFNTHTSKALVGYSLILFLFFYLSDLKVSFIIAF